MNALALAGNGYVYAFTSSPVGGIYSVNTSTGIVTAAGTALNTFWSGTWPLLTRDGKRYLYTEYAKFDISDGPAALVSKFSYAACGEFWTSTDGTKIFDACGQVLRSSDAPAVDLTVEGSLPGMSLVVWAADSGPAVHQVAALGNDLGGTPDGYVSLYDDSALTLLTKSLNANFLVGSTSYAGFGQNAFWSKDSSKLFVVEKADPASNLVANYGISTINTAASSPTCTFTVTGTADSVSAAGGSASFTVTASAPTCTWSSFAPGSSWYTITSGFSGTGNGSVVVQLGGYGFQQPGAYAFNRSATLTIAGQTETVTQDPPCSFTLTASNSSFWANGGSGTVSVATGKGCPWIATSSANWLTFSSATTGTGNGSINFVAAANTTGSAQNGNVTVGITANAFPPSQVYINEAIIPTPLGPLRFVPITPCRVADTRNATGPFGGPMIAAGDTRDFRMTSSGCGVPSTAQAYSLNVTAVPPGGLGYLTIWPSGQAKPLASLLNSDGRVKAVASIVPCG